jgi:antitoxin (DNA-binding transcriptional repressor) of toxin-antitoxin stability system
MGHLSIRDLQKISGEAIQNLPGTTAITSGGRTIALLTPLKKPDLAKLQTALEQARALAEMRDPAEDERFLREIGADPTDWTQAAIEQLLAERRGHDQR